MLLFGFIVLQVLDALTTIAFLHRGVSEANPLMQFFLNAAARPELALAGPKMFAVALAIYAWRSGRIRLLRTMNLVFAVCVAWNVAAILSAPR